MRRYRLFFQNVSFQRVIECNQGYVLSPESINMNVIKDSAEKFSVLDYAPVGICVINDEYTVLFWNQCLEDWTGIPKPGIEGENLGTHFPWLNAPRYRMRLETIFEGGPPAIFSSQLHKHLFPSPLPNGEMRIQHTTVSGIPANKDEKSYYALWAVEDVTELTRRIHKYRIMRDKALDEMRQRKQMEEELLKAKKLESIGILTGGIAHDFNNLLTVIVGNIGLVQDDIKPGEEAFEFLKEAENASFRAQELIRQLITFSKGGAPFKETGSVGEMIKELTIPGHPDSDVKYELSIQHDLRLAEFDKGQMKHAVRNLITNAVESIPHGGSIKVSAENFDMGPESPEKNLALPTGKYVKIIIRDQGVGIPEEHLTCIFDPYFSTKERGTQKGMGMGLATTYSIIRKHDGHITVESGPGSGTAFTIYLPAHQEEIAEPESFNRPQAEKSASRSGRILIMDDEEMIRKFVSKMLDKLGYDSELAGDGSEAIELYKNAMDTGMSFDAVILDLTVKEGMGGKDAVMKLLTTDPDLKAIVSSAYLNDPVMTDFKKHGFIGALPKPYTKKQLSDMLSMVGIGKNDHIGETSEVSETSEV